MEIGVPTPGAFIRFAKTYSVVAVALGVYTAHKLVARQLDGQLAGLQLLVSLDAAVALVFVSVRYPKSSREIRFLTAGVGLILGVYAAAVPMWLPMAMRGAWPALATILHAGRYLAPVVAIAGLWRPSAVFAVASYVSFLRLAYPYLYGLDRVGGSDYIPVVEVAMFASLSLMVWSAGGRLARLKTSSHAMWLGEAGLSGLFVVAIGALFGSYFYSGVAKMLLDGPPLTWMMHNSAATLMPITMTTGHLPIGHWPEFASGFYRMLSALAVPSNVMILLVELGAVIAITRRAWIGWIAGGYCLMHTLIFLSSGIFFWKWILLDLVIIGAVWQWRGAYAWSARAIGVVSILAAPLFPFTTLTLAWYDTPAVNRFFFEVELDDGRRLEVPTNFFGPVSLTPAQMRLGTFGDSLWPTRTWGMNWDAAERERLLRCDTALRSDESPYREVQWDRVAFFFASAMAWHLENPSTRYDMFPHHIFSNPNLFEFTSDDVGRVESAFYVSESYCVEFADLSGRKLETRREEQMIFHRRRHAE